MKLPSSLTSEKIVTYRILPQTRLLEYELDLLSSDVIAQALPLQLLSKRGEKYIHILKPKLARSLKALDSKVRRGQRLGLERMIKILAALQDAKARLLRPSFYYLSLDSIYLHGTQLRLPLLPVGEGEAVRQPETSIFPDFWNEWQAFYHVQVELAKLGQKLGSEGQYKKLSEIYISYLKKYKPRNDRHNKKLHYGIPHKINPMPRVNNLHTSIGPRPRTTTARSNPARLNPAILNSARTIQATNELPRTIGESAVAELLIRGKRKNKKKSKRLALLLEDEFVLGRDPSFSDLCFRDPWVGRKHLRITKDKDNFYIEDLASLNGTYVDGRKLQKHESLLLPEQSLIRLGKTTLEFRRIH